MIKESEYLKRFYLNNLGYRIWSIGEEIKKKRKKSEEIWNEHLTTIILSPALITVLILFFIISKQEHFWKTSLSIVLGLTIFSWACWYRYRKYQRECQKIEELERDKYLLKLELEEWEKQGN